MTDKLAAIFDLEPIEYFEQESPTNDEPVVLETELVNPPTDPAVELAEKDFDEVRTLMKSLLDRGQKVLNTAELVAISSQNNKDIDSFFKGLDSITKTSKEIMNIHRDMVGIKPAPVEIPSEQKADTINNIIFQGSPGEFIQMLRQQKLLENKTDE